MLLATLNLDSSILLVKKLSSTCYVNGTLILSADSLTGSSDYTLCLAP